MSEDLSGLDLVALFDLLVQPDAPARMSMMPQTAGWIWLGLGLATAAAVASWRTVASRRANAYRHAALQALDAAGDDPATIANILRRTALAGYPRDLVAGLTGNDWLAFLDSVAEGVTFAGTEAGTALAAAPYRPVAAHPDLPDLARRWVTAHKPQKGAR